MGCSDGWNNGGYVPPATPPTAREIELIERLKAVEQGVRELKKTPVPQSAENEILRTENKNLRETLNGVIDMMNDIMEFIENS